MIDGYQLGFDRLLWKKMVLDSSRPEDLRLSNTDFALQGLEKLILSQPVWTRKCGLRVEKASSELVDILDKK